MDILDLAARIESYDPRLSPDNCADEMELHRDIVLATGIGTMNPAFEATFLRSLDAAKALMPEGCNWLKCLDERGHVMFAVYADDGTELGRSIYAGDDALCLVAASLRALAQSGGDN